VAVLHAANLGDSGFWVLRMIGEEGRARMSVAHKSRSQSHSLNCPYQVLLYVCMDIYMCVYMCMCMWMSCISHAPSHAPSHTHLINRTRCCYKCVWIYLCAYISMYMWMSCSGKRRHGGIAHNIVCFIGLFCKRELSL